MNTSGYELAWKYVDLGTSTSLAMSSGEDVRACSCVRSGSALLSFERPASSSVFSFGRTLGAGAHLENSIAAYNVFFTIKRLRAHGGCLGAKSR